MSDFRLETRSGAAIDEAKDSVIIARTRDYNAQFLPNEFEPFSVYVHSDSNEIVGGLTAKLFWQWLHVDYLWVDAVQRHQGIGTQILQRAEAFARSRRCTGITLNTFSFQALEFYQKCGYQQFGLLSKYQDDHERHYLQKRLD